VVGCVACILGLCCIFLLVASPVYDYVYSVLARRLAGKSIYSVIYYSVSSGMLNLNVVNQSACLCTFNILSRDAPIV